jgi:ubiquinone/menaquinone biosynthesis C-methylase UbiE
VSRKREGWSGWDDYAPFYDWENARTLGRRDVPFWRRIAARAAGGRVLELGCGTGRISVPLARDGASLVGVDRSAAMLARAARRVAAGGRVTRRRGRQHHLRLVRGDIRALPFRNGVFQMVLAPYGVLQSLTRERDLRATLASVARVLEPGGLLGIDLVPDVPDWPEYSDRVQLRGRSTGGRHITLIESVRQDRRRRLTIFTQRYLERHRKTTIEHSFDLTFRTLPVPQMRRRLARAGFDVEAVLGDYHGRSWDSRAEVWIILARRQGAQPTAPPMSDMVRFSVRSR